MIHETFDDKGRVVRSVDTVAHTVTEKGVTRPMTADEIAVANIENADNAVLTNESTLQDRVREDIATLKELIGPADAAAGSTTINAILNQTNATINSSAATYVKAIARNQRNIAKAVVRLDRLVSRTLDSTE